MSLDQPHSPLSFSCMDLDLEPLSLSGDSSCEEHGGALFCNNETMKLKDRFSKVSALGFTHDNAFVAVPEFDQDNNLYIKITSAFDILPEFEVPVTLEVRLFKNVDSWSVSISLICLTFLKLRKLISSSMFSNWLNPDFSEIEYNSVSKNRQLKEDAYNYAQNLFDQFVKIAK